jgi:signal transduction histidine kinase
MSRPSEQTVERLAELVAINRSIAAATDYDELQRLVVERTAGFLQAEATLLVIADERGRARISASHGVAVAADKAFDAPFDERVGLELGRAFGCEASRFLASPVVEGGSVRGMLVVFLREPSSDDEVALLAALADQIAIALGNAMRLRRLEDAVSALREADRRKDDFLGMLSHELRNPLAPIRTSVYLLNHAGADTQAAETARQVIGRQTDHLTKLIDDLLDVTRIARGKVEIKREPIDVAEVVGRAADDHRPLLSERGLAVRFDIPRDEAWVIGDATRIAQIVANLLDNAAKFTPRGGEVGIALERTDGTVQIRVYDTGVGIEPSLRSRVFEPFVQAERTLARSRGGLGLGLALVKGFVQLHGGTVGVASTGAEKGSEFIVRLPRIASPHSLSTSLPITCPKINAKRVLVVDDNRDAAESLARLVATFGHTPTIAYDGASALEIVKQMSPDAVLCDIGLPGMSGYDFARAVRGAGVDGIRLIAISGYALIEDVRKALDAGFEAHIAKPADPGAIERLLAQP